MKISPNDPAYPVYRQSFGNGITLEPAAFGMPVRLEIASRLMSGMMANPNAASVGVEQIASYAPKNAMKLADALIEVYNDTVGD